MGTKRNQKSRFNPNTVAAGNWRFLDDFEQISKKKKVKSPVQSVDPTLDDDQYSKTTDSLMGETMDQPQASVAKDKRISFNFNTEQEILLHFKRR